MDLRKIKGVVLGWIYRTAVRVHPRYGIYLVNRTLPFGKPTLDYLEFHLADHCNLNCAGCLHYAPLAEKKFADIEVVRHDFARLSELFGNIRHVRIMGGEPLLHPKVVEAAQIVKAAFPRSRVRVVTNGILLPKFDGLPELAKIGVGIDWTKYPPVAAKEDEIRRVCKAAGVDLRVTENNSFMARLRLDGGEGILKAFRWCREHMYCPLLDSGKVYPCAPAHFAPAYNRVANTNIYVETGLDIHTATAKDIMLYLMRPSFSCRYCAADARHFGWKVCEGPKDWLL